jgi:hypothetical protein
MSTITRTRLLPPITGVKLVWAQTGSFTSDVNSKLAATVADDQLKDIRARADRGGNAAELELEYVNCASATMEASLRNLDIIYKGRQLKFQENAQLREAYMEQIKEGFDFGGKAKDFLKALPMMTFTGAGGVTLVKLLNLPDWALWVAGLGLAAVGYGINLLVVQDARRKKQHLFMLQYYERSVYYDQYLGRSVQSLAALYTELNRIHANVFTGPYDADTTPADQVIRNTLAGTEPTFCDYVHKHMKAGIITPEMWAQCESKVPAPDGSGGEAPCPFWAR